MTTRERLARLSGRPTLAAIAAMNAITGILVAVILAPLSFGTDAIAYRKCAEFAVAGRLDCGSFYPPLAALAVRPLTWVPPTVAALVMSAIGLAILAAGLRLETRGREPVDRLLVAVAAIGFVPVVYELILGQVTFLIMAALYPVARRGDGFRNGIPLGIALALAPKPLLLPVLAWMLIWRRQALLGTLVTAVALTGLGVVLAGPDQYRQWAAVLSNLGRESASGTSAASLHGSFSLWPLDPLPIVVALAVVAATAWATWRDATRGFVAALLAGLLLSPYTELYSATILLLAVQPAVMFAPRATRVLALIANPVLAFLLGFVAWALGGLAASIPVPVTGRTSRL